MEKSRSSLAAASVLALGLHAAPEAFAKRSAAESDRQQILLRCNDLRREVNISIDRFMAEIPQLATALVGAETQASYGLYAMPRSLFEVEKCAGEYPDGKDDLSLARCVRPSVTGRGIESDGSSGLLGIGALDFSSHRTNPEAVPLSAQVDQCLNGLEGNVRSETVAKGVYSRLSPEVKAKTEGERRAAEERAASLSQTAQEAARNLRQAELQKAREQANRLEQLRRQRDRK